MKHIGKIVVNLAMGVPLEVSAEPEGNSLLEEREAAIKRLAELEALYLDNPPKISDELRRKLVIGVT